MATSDTHCWYSLLPESLDDLAVLLICSFGMDNLCHVTAGSMAFPESSPVARPNKLVCPRSILARTHLIVTNASPSTLY